MTDPRQIDGPSTPTSTITFPSVVKPADGDITFTATITRDPADAGPTPVTITDSDGSALGSLTLTTPAGTQDISITVSNSSITCMVKPKVTCASPVDCDTFFSIPYSELPQTVLATIQGGCFDGLAIPLTLLPYDSSRPGERSWQLYQTEYDNMTIDGCQPYNYVTADTILLTIYNEPDGCYAYFRCWLSPTSTSVVETDTGNSLVKPDDINPRSMTLDLPGESRVNDWFNANPRISDCADCAGAVNIVISA